MSRMADLDEALRQWLATRTSLDATPSRIIAASDDLVACLLPDRESFARMFGSIDNLSAPNFPPNLCQDCGENLPLDRLMASEPYCVECE